MKRIIVATALLMLTACAGEWREFKPGMVDEQDGAFMARVLVNYNGKPYTKHCAVAFNEDNHPKVELDKTGLIITKAHVGKVTLNRLECTDTSLYHYNFHGAEFYNPGKGAIVFIGDIVLEWNTVGGPKPAMRYSAAGGVADLESSKNDGAVRMTVSDDPNFVVNAYLNSIEGHGKLAVKKSLIRIGR